MIWTIMTEKGRKFKVEAEGEETARGIAETCLRKGEEIDLIEPAFKAKKEGEKKEETKSQGEEEKVSKGEGAEKGKEV